MFKKIATYFMVTLMALIFLLDILKLCAYNLRNFDNTYNIPPYFCICLLYTSDAADEL